jgi:uroporphyrinogen decarboxylase
VGALSPEDYATFAEPHVRHVLADLVQTGVPVIHFGTATHSLLELQKRAGGTVIGVDWRTPIEDARRRLGADVALQGNLDPILLFAPREVLAKRASDLLNRAGKSGYVFNLGHGILPQTDPDQVRFLCDWVHEQTV